MDLNPSVINQEMVATAIRGQYKQKEIMRLSEESPDWSSVRNLRLEFQGK